MTLLSLALLLQSLQWRHNEQDGVSNHQRLECLLNRLFRPRSKKTSKLRVTGLCEGNSPVTGEFPAQRASKAENVSIWWRRHSYWSITACPELQWSHPEGFLRIHSPRTDNINPPKHCTIKLPYFMGKTPYKRWQFYSPFRRVETTYWQSGNHPIAWQRPSITIVS